ncbi:MAG: hypothetical protein ACJA1I_000488 [Zhongshania marina]|jgi:hypothetical protein
MGWNPVKSIKKAVKKVTGGIKKVFSGVKKIGGKVVDGLRSVGREVKRFAKSDLGKIVIAAALIYVGGAAFLAMNSAGTMSFASALASPGAVVGQLGIGAGAGAGSGGAASGTAAATGTAGSTAGMTGVAAAEGAGLSSGLTTTAAKLGLNGAATTGAASAAGGSAIGTGSAVANAAGGGLLSEGVKYGALMVGGNAIAGSMQAKGAVEAEKEAEKARQRYIDNNVVPDVNLDNIAGLKYNPMTGSDEAESTEAYLPENLRVNTNLNNKYTSQGLLTQGAS